MPRYNDDTSYALDSAPLRTGRSLGYAVNGANPPIITTTHGDVLDLHENPAKGGIDHGPIPTQDQADGLNNAPTPITAANPVASVADIGGGLDPTLPQTIEVPWTFEQGIIVGVAPAQATISVSGTRLVIDIPAGSTITSVDITKDSADSVLQVDELRSPVA